MAKVGEQEKLLQENSKGGIIKREWDESEHPRDDKGLFVNKGFTKQTLFLPKEEYATVLQEINNIYHLRFEDKTEGHIELFMDDDIYVYLFEIKEYVQI